RPQPSRWRQLQNRRLARSSGFPTRACRQSPRSASSLGQRRLLVARLDPWPPRALAVRSRPPHAAQNLCRSKSRSNNRLPRPTPVPKTPRQTPASFGFSITSRVRSFPEGLFISLFLPTELGTTP